MEETELKDHFVRCIDGWRLFSFKVCFFVCFLLYKKKLRRLIKYMQFRDYKSKVLKTIDDEDLLDSGMICVVFSDISRIFFYIS